MSSKSGTSSKSPIKQSIIFNDEREAIKYYHHKDLESRDKAMKRWLEGKANHIRPSTAPVNSRERTIFADDFRIRKNQEAYENWRMKKEQELHEKKEKEHERILRNEEIKKMREQRDIIRRREGEKAWLHWLIKKEDQRQQEMEGRKQKQLDLKYNNIIKRNVAENAFQEWLAMKRYTSETSPKFCNPKSWDNDTCID